MNNLVNFKVLTLMLENILANSGFDVKLIKVEDGFDIQIREKKEGDNEPSSDSKTTE